jgi:hypothetical protein
LREIRQQTPQSPFSQEIQNLQLANIFDAPTAAKVSAVVRMVRDHTSCYLSLQSDPLESNWRTNELKARFRQPAARGNVLLATIRAQFLTTSVKFDSTSFLALIFSTPPLTHIMLNFLTRPGGDILGSSCPKHRLLVARKWDYSDRRRKKPGRPALSQEIREIRDLVVRSWDRHGRWPSNCRNALREGFVYGRK